MERYELLYPYSQIYFDTQDFKMGIMQKGNFVTGYEVREAGSVFTYGFNDVKQSMRNMYRMAARALLLQVNKVLGIQDKEMRRNFINGGTYSNGLFVEETIIYVPYTYGGYGSHPHTYGEYQAIFTFITKYLDEGARGHDGTVVYDLNDQVKNLMVAGMRIQEDKGHHFDAVLSALELYSPWRADYLHAEFNLDTKDEVKFIGYNPYNFITMIETAADLIKKHYFNGMSYEELSTLKKLEVELVESK
jgi:hypothetical protein